MGNFLTIVKLKNAFPEANITKDNAMNVNMPKSDVIITNPPFGSLKAHTEDGQEEYVYKCRWNNKDAKIKQIDHAIALKALDNMKDDGKAVIIVGGMMTESDDPGHHKRLFNHILYNDFNVVDKMQIGGNIYESEGTKFPVLVYFINGKRLGQHNTTINRLEEVENVNNWNGIAERLQGIRGYFYQTDGRNAESNEQRLEPSQRRFNEKTQESYEIPDGKTISGTEQRNKSDVGRNDRLDTESGNRNNKDEAVNAESKREKVLSDTRGQRNSEKSSRNADEQRNDNRTDGQWSGSVLEQTENDNVDNRTNDERTGNIGNNDISRPDESRGLNENNNTQTDKKVEYDEELQSEYKTRSRNTATNYSVVPKNIRGSIEFDDG